MQKFHIWNNGYIKYEIEVYLASIFLYNINEGGFNMIELSFVLLICVYINAICEISKGEDK